MSGAGAQVKRGADLLPGMAVFAGLADVLAREPPGSVLDLADRLDASVVVIWRSGRWLNIGRAMVQPPDWRTMSITTRRVH